MSADSFENQLQETLGTIAAQQEIIAACTVTWKMMHHDNRGGGEARVTGPRARVVAEAVERKIKEIDPYQSPHVGLPLQQMPDGSWRSSVRWFGLGD